MQHPGTLLEAPLPEAVPDKGRIFELNNRQLIRDQVPASHDLLSQKDPLVFEDERVAAQ